MGPRPDAPARPAAGSALRPATIARAARHAAIVVVGFIALGRSLGLLWPEGVDFHAYWAADLDDLYSGPFGRDAFLYSPAFAQAMQPLAWLPFPVALGLWTLLCLGCLVWLAGPWSLPLMLFLAPEWINGNVHLPMAAAVVLGLRFPAAWAFPLLTKLAPGVGLLWFVVRREWRAFAIGVGTFALMVAVSFLVSPAAWLAWVQMLAEGIAQGSAPPVGGYVSVPLWIRAPVAVALLVWGARSGRAWAVPLAAGLAMPVLWISAVIAFALAAWRLRTGADAPRAARAQRESGRAGLA